MPRTLSFIAPSLHPNTLVDLSFSEPGPSTREPIVRHLAVKHGEHQPLGLVKRMNIDDSDKLVVVDDAFRISTLSLGSSDTPSPPEILSQHTVQGKRGDVWTGLVSVQAGSIASLSSGSLTLLPKSESATIHSRNVPSPLLTLASSTSSTTDFALAGKEVEVSVWDVERTFSNKTSDETPSSKRKKDTLELGEVWRARNLPNNHLSLRQPIYHLCMSYLPDKPNDIVTGTKAGSVRRYDTRQRKPVSDWKLAREGGIGAITPGVEHELFFADRSSFLGSIDLRTGKLLYSYPKQTSTAHHLLSIPSLIDTRKSKLSSKNIGLATISSDATFRIHSTTPPPLEAGKGNIGTRGSKGSVEGMVGGVGLGGFVWRGWGFEDGEEVLDERKGRNRKLESGDEEDESDGDVWEGMGDIEDDNEEEDDEEEAISAKRVKK